MPRPMRTYRASEDIPPAYGRCAVCHLAYRLTDKGVMRMHMDSRVLARYERPVCAGSGLRPAVAS